MKVCFFHEQFDIDVSSGSTHSAYQWIELLNAMGVKECAVINKTDSPFPYVSSDVKINEYNSYEEFWESDKGALVMFADPKGDYDYKSVPYGEFDWIVFGGADSVFDPEASIRIDTNNNASLYPREAAAIILGEMFWQLR